MRIPRDLSGSALARALESLGYAVTRQTGSHMRLGTLSAILADVADHFGMSRSDRTARLFEHKSSSQ